MFTYYLLKTIPVIKDAAFKEDHKDTVQGMEKKPLNNKSTRLKGKATEQIAGL